VAYGSIFNGRIEAIGFLAITMKSKRRFIAEQPLVLQWEVGILYAEPGSELV